MKMQKPTTFHQDAEGVCDAPAQNLSRAVGIMASLEMFADGREDLPPQVRDDLTTNYWIKATDNQDLIHNYNSL